MASAVSGPGRCVIPKISTSTVSIHNRVGVPRKCFQPAQNRRQIARGSASAGSEPSSDPTPSSGSDTPWLTSIRSR